MDELFEALTLIQTGKIEQFPVVLIGRTYWASLTALLHDMANAGTIAAGDLDLLLVTDDLDDAVAHLERHAVEPFGLQKRRVPQPFRWLGEPAPIESKIATPGA